MTLPVILIRPEPGCTASVAAARAAGMPAEGWPLSAAQPLDWTGPDSAEADALLLGSANALRHAGPGLARYAALPAYAVGAATAAAARAAGLAVVAEGSGGLQGLLDALAPGHSRLLRLGGEERVALTPPPGVTLTERAVYRITHAPLPAALAERLAKGALVLLHSAEVARHFATEVDRAGLPRAAIALATIGPRVSAAAGSGWAALHAAPTPDDASLLALAAQLCQNPGQATT
jgi:uroporphyrinogen-III synthase